MGVGRQISGSVRHCLSNLLSVRGRDGLAQFWPYALLIMLLGGMTIIGVMVPVLAGTITKMQAMAQDNPEDFIIRQSPSSYEITYVGDDPAVLAQLTPDFSALIIVVGLAMLVPIAFVATAAVRRLHDRGISGKWLLIPATLLALSFSLMPGVFEDVGKGSGAGLGIFALVFAITLAYNLSVLVFLVLFALPGNPNDNRYGSPLPNVR